MIERWIDRREAFREWKKRLLCAHPGQPVNREIRHYEGHGVYTWMLLWECPNCESTLAVEASWKGRPEMLLKILEQEVHGR